MTDKKIRKFKRKQVIRSVVPYILVTGAVFGVVFAGSKDKDIKQSGSLNMESIAAGNYSVTADQISEFYTVSQLANSMDLATAKVVDLNYNTVTMLRESGQTSIDKIEKPGIVNTDDIASTGVDSYVVKEGDTVDSIAAQPKYKNYGVDSTMIRWSNNLKASATLTVGSTIYVPSRSGFVHKVKSGEDINSVASKYGSSVEQIVAANGLELNPSVSEGMVILIPDGNLPENERPDYVPPKPAVVTPTVTYTHFSWSANNPMPYGWCTYYAWGRRSEMGDNMRLPSSGLYNANTWVMSLSGTFAIDRTPRVGDVFQTMSGWYGHVGIVDAVNADGTITVSDMNGIAGWGRVGTATWDQAKWSQYYFIHGRL